MARVAGVNIPIHKHTAIALTHIFGIRWQPGAQDLRCGRDNAKDQGKNAPRAASMPCAARGRQVPGGGRSAA